MYAFALPLAQISEKRKICLDNICWIRSSELNFSLLVQHFVVSSQVLKLNPSNTCVSQNMKGKKKQTRKGLIFSAKSFIIHEKTIKLLFQSVRQALLVSQNATILQLIPFNFLKKKRKKEKKSNGKN
ncbi:hypothetical protein E2320_013410, partial [Naja naja]